MTLSPSRLSGLDPTWRMKVMTDNDFDFVLDGNAAAGALREVFAADATAADIQCDACGSVGAVQSALTTPPRWESC